MLESGTLGTKGNTQVLSFTQAVKLRGILDVGRAIYTNCIFL